MVLEEGLTPLLHTLSKKARIVNLTPFRVLLGNPIPFIPFPLIRGRGINYMREDFYPTKTLFLRGPRISLSLTLLIFLLGKERGLGGWVN